MCGLAGWIGDPKVTDGQRLNRARALEALLLANAQRGTDATGVCMVHANQQTIYKKAVNAFNLVVDPALNETVRMKDSFIALGHTRWGTMGANTDANAHPFKEGTVIGTHNGVIWNYAELERQMDGHKPLRVDSQVIFRVLAGVESKGETIAKALPLLAGSLALAWVDTRDPNALWVFKHDNPFSMVIADTAKAAFWSSEYAHLAPVMQAIYGQGWEPTTIAPDTLYRFFWDGELMKSMWPVEMEKRFKSNYSNGSTHISKKEKKRLRRQEPENKNGPVATDDDGNVTPLEQYLANSIGPKMSMKQVDANIRNGKMDWDDALEDCSMCGRPMDWDDDDAMWYNEGHRDEDGYSLCGACSRWWESSGRTVYGNLTEAVRVTGRI